MPKHILILSTMKKIRRLILCFLLTLLTFPATAGDVRYLTTEQFIEIFFDFRVSNQWEYHGDVPCVIDFYTTWCGPCRKLAPIMEDLSEQYCGDVVFYKVDTEKERFLAYFFGINSIPQILFVPKEGKPQLAKGLLPKDVLEQAIEDILLHPAARAADK